MRALSSVRPALAGILVSAALGAGVTVGHSAPQSAATAGHPVVQNILQGPMAAYDAPKVLGLNGPGITGADCAHPFENPTPLSQFLQWMLFFSVPVFLLGGVGQALTRTSAPSPNP